MRVKIGGHKSWVGCYQIAEMLCFWAKKDKDGEKPDYVHDFGTWLSETKTGEDSWLTKFCEWIYSKRKRNIKIRIDNYDVWNFDSTLAQIILPGLKMIQEDKHGAPFVDDNDVPDELKSINAPPKEHEHDTDEFWFKRWTYVLDEMIFAMESICDNSWEDQFHHGKINFKFEKCKEKPKKGLAKDIEELSDLIDLTYGEKKKDDGLFEMIEEKDSDYWFDKNGYAAYSDRIQNGCRLFGKYFQNLWT